MSQVAELNSAKSATSVAMRLQDRVQEHLDGYFSKIGNIIPNGIYNLVLRHVEKPLLEVVLQQMRYNQSKTAFVLGMSRGTLRKKMKSHGLLREDF